MPAPALSLELLFHPDPPKRFTARLGDGGWLDAFGWTEEEAVRAVNTAAYATRVHPQRVSESSAAM